MNDAGHPVGQHRNPATAPATHRVTLGTLRRLIDPSRVNEVESAALAGDHLLDCPHQHDARNDSCRWCDLAVVTPHVERLVDSHHDIRALSTVEHPTVAWLAAIDTLADLARGLTIDDLRRPSAVLIAGEIRRAVSKELVTLTARAAHAGRPGGPIEQACIAAGGHLAIAEVATNPATWHGIVPERISDDISRVCVSLSPQRLHTILRPITDRMMWEGLPRLRTQPEWERLPGPPHADQLTAAQLEGTNAGSLEALVLEAIIADDSEELIDIGHELAGINTPLVPICRHPRTHPSWGATRAMTWRRARIDWIITFLDSTNAHCWPRTADDTIEVPWCVAASIAFSESQGYESATHPNTSTDVAVSGPMHGMFPMRV